MKARALQAAAGIAIAFALGAAAFCCGPKVDPVAIAPPCPGDKIEVCDPPTGDLGEHNCVCPE